MANSPSSSFNPRSSILGFHRADGKKGGEVSSAALGSFRQLQRWLVAHGAAPTACALGQLSGARHLRDGALQLRVQLIHRPLHDILSRMCVRDALEAEAELERVAGRDYRAFGEARHRHVDEAVALGRCREAGL